MRTPVRAGKVLCENWRPGLGSLRFRGGLTGRLPALCKTKSCYQCGRAYRARLVAGIIDGWLAEFPGLEPWHTTFTIAWKRESETWRAFEHRNHIDLWQIPPMVDSGRKKTLGFRDAKQAPVWCNSVDCPKYVRGKHTHTATYRRSFWPDEYWPDYMAEIWRRFIQRFERKFVQGKLPFLRVVELTDQGVPHLHVITPSMEHLGLSERDWWRFAVDNWLDITGDSYNIKVERGYNDWLTALCYVTKYITKDYQNDKGFKRNWSSGGAFPIYSKAAEVSVVSSTGELFNRKQWASLRNRWRYLRTKGKLPRLKKHGYDRKNRMKGFPDGRLIQSQVINDPSITDEQIGQMCDRELRSLYDGEFGPEASVLVDEWKKHMLVYARRPVLASWKPFTKKEQADGDFNPEYEDRHTFFGPMVTLDQYGELA